jgi:hypothetical protein
MVIAYYTLIISVDVIIQRYKKLWGYNSAGECHTGSVEGKP